MTGEGEDEKADVSVEDGDVRAEGGGVHPLLTSIHCQAHAAAVSAAAKESRSIQAVLMRLLAFLEQQVHGDEANATAAAAAAMPSYSQADQHRLVADAPKP